MDKKPLLCPSIITHCAFGNDFIYSVERVPNKREDMVTMRLFPKNKESIAIKLEEYLFSQKIPIEQFNVNRGRLDEVFRALTN